MRGKYLKRQILLSSLCFCCMAAVGWADAGFWFGPKGLYFHPSNANIQRFYKTFWGWGGEAGWAYKYFEGSLEVSYVQAKGKINMDETEIGVEIVGQYWKYLSALSVTPRVAFRLRPQRTPYVGVTSPHPVAVDIVQKGKGLALSWDPEEYAEAPKKPGVKPSSPPPVLEIRVAVTPSWVRPYPSLFRTLGFIPLARGECTYTPALPGKRYTFDCCVITPDGQQSRPARIFLPL